MTKIKTIHSHKGCKRHYTPDEVWDKLISSDVGAGVIIKREGNKIYVFCPCCLSEDSEGNLKSHRCVIYADQNGKPVCHKTGKDGKDFCFIEEDVDGYLQGFTKYNREKPFVPATNLGLSSGKPEHRVKDTTSNRCIEDYMQKDIEKRCNLRELEDNGLYAPEGAELDITRPNVFLEPVFDSDGVWIGSTGKLRVMQTTWNAVKGRYDKDVWHVWYDITANKIRWGSGNFADVMLYGTHAKKQSVKLITITEGEKDATLVNDDTTDKANAMSMASRSPHGSVPACLQDATITLMPDYDITGITKALKYKAWLESDPNVKPASVSIRAPYIPNAEGIHDCQVHKGYGAADYVEDIKEYGTELKKPPKKINYKKGKQHRDGILDRMLDTDESRVAISKERIDNHLMNEGVDDTERITKTLEALKLADRTKAAKASVAFPKDIVDTIETQHGKYLNPITINDNEILYVKSGTGTGKTEACLNYLADMVNKGGTTMNVLIIVSRISLERQMNKRVNGKVIDPNNYIHSYKELADSYGINVSVTFCMDSLPRIDENAKYDIVMIDEGRLAINHLVSPTYIKKNRKLIADIILPSIIRNAGKVVVMDADLDTFTIEMYNDMKGDKKTRLIENTYQKPRNIYIAKDTVEAFGLALERALKKQSMYIYIDNIQQQGIMRTFILENTNIDPNRVGYVTADSPLESVQATESTEAIEKNNIDIFITSPCKMSGVDYQNKRGVAIIFGNANHSTKYTIEQAMGRFRPVEDVIVVLKNDSTSPIPTLEETREFHTKILRCDAKERGKKMPNIKDNKFFENQIKILHKLKVERMSVKTDFLNSCAAKGLPVKEIEASVIPRKVITKKMKEAKDKYKKDSLADMRLGNWVTDEELNDLTHKAYKCRERLRIQPLRDLKMNVYHRNTEDAEHDIGLQDIYVKNTNRMLKDFASIAHSKFYDMAKDKYPEVQDMRRRMRLKTDRDDSVVDIRLDTPEKLDRHFNTILNGFGTIVPKYISDTPWTEPNEDEIWDLVHTEIWPGCTYLRYMKEIKYINITNIDKPKSELMGLLKREINRRLKLPHGAHRTRIQKTITDENGNKKTKKKWFKMVDREQVSLLHRGGNKYFVDNFISKSKYVIPEEDMEGMDNLLKQKEIKKKRKGMLAENTKYDKEGLVKTKAKKMENDEQTIKEFWGKKKVEDAKQRIMKKRPHKQIDITNSLWGRISKNVAKETKIGMKLDPNLKSHWLYKLF